MMKLIYYFVMTFALSTCGGGGDTTPGQNTGNLFSTELSSIDFTMPGKGSKVGTSIPNNMDTIEL